MILLRAPGGFYSYLVSGFTLQCSEPEHCATAGTFPATGDRDPEKHTHCDAGTVFILNKS